MRKLSEIILQPDGRIDFTKLPIGEEFEIDRSILMRSDYHKFYNEMIKNIKSMDGHINMYEGHETGGTKALAIIYANVHEINDVVSEKPITFDFSQALIELKAGRAVRLPSWREDVRIKCMFPSEDSEMSAPYLYVESRFGRVPWKETMIELFSTDWQIVE